MKTLSQFLKESADKEEKIKQKRPTFFMSSSSHSVPYHERMTSEEAPIKKSFEGDTPEPFRKATHNSREGRDALEAHYGHPTPTARGHIHSYTGDSTYINKSLIAKHEDPSDHYHAAEHDSIHGNTQKALDDHLSSHKAPSDIHVYSGTGFNPERFKPADHDGKSHFKIHLPAYSSTSINPEEAKGFAQRDNVSAHAGHTHGEHKHMLHIEVPKGSHGAYIDHHSVNQGEHEFLLPRGSNISVHPHPTIVGHGKNTTAVWHAKLHQEND